MPSPLALAFNLPFAEAIDAAKARGVVLPDQYYGELQGLARQLAFSVSGLAGLDQVQAVKDSLDKSMSEGLSFGQWKKLAAVADLNLPAHRLDNIFRTNLQGQYLRGKWEQFDRNRDHRPFLMYDAINDSRVRPAHLAMDNVIRAIDDPWWQTHSPPNGFRCRCSILSLTADQAKARTGPDSGLNKQPVTPDHRPAEPDPGWDFNPYEDRLAGVRKAVENRHGKTNSTLFDALMKRMDDIKYSTDLEIIREYLIYANAKNAGTKQPPLDFSKAPYRFAVNTGANNQVMALDHDYARHILLRHGSESERNRGQEPVTAEDFQIAIGKLIESPFTIIEPGTPPVAKNGGKRYQAFGIIDGWHYTAVYEIRRHRIVLVTLFKRKA